MLHFPLGDWIAALTNFIGIKPTEECGCAKRRRVLNNLYWYL